MYGLQFIFEKCTSGYWVKLSFVCKPLLLNVTKNNAIYQILDKDF